MKQKQNLENEREAAWEKDRYELEPKRKESSNLVGSDEDLDQPGAPTVLKQNQTTAKTGEGDNIPGELHRGGKENEVEDVEEKSPNI